jgi:predicted transcriptional regulator
MDLELQTPITIAPDVTVKLAIELLAAQGFDTLPVVAESGQILGVVTEGNLTAKLVANRIEPDDVITAAIYTCVPTSTHPLRHHTGVDVSRPCMSGGVLVTLPPFPLGHPTGTSAR